MPSLLLLLLCLLPYARGVPLRVLAFGDSLTEGLYVVNESAVPSFHPYATELQRLLRAKGDKDAEVAQAGMSGELVIPSGMINLHPVAAHAELPPMTERLQWLLGNASVKGQQYQWAIILGGLNDLGSGRRSGNVFEGLRYLYEMCKERGVKVVAMTIFENVISSRNEGVNQLNIERGALNSLIKEYVHRSQGLDEMVLLDMEKLIPYDSMDADTRAKLWSDGVHLTPAGYDLMAKFIYEALVEQFDKNKGM